MSEQKSLHERRLTDEQITKVRDDVAQLRGEFLSYREEIRDSIRAQSEQIGRLAESLQEIQRLVERGKVLVWVIAGIAAFLAWAETRWQWITKIARALLHF